MNTKNIFELYRNTNARVFWLMYDMAPFTGGCHYAWDCNGYRERCGRCPGLYSDDPEDISNKNLLFKRSTLERPELRLSQLQNGSSDRQGRVIFSVTN